MPETEPTTELNAGFSEPGAAGEPRPRRGTAARPLWVPGVQRGGEASGGDVVHVAGDADFG
jgi:hypothetical protein